MLCYEKVYEKTANMTRNGCEKLIIEMHSAHNFFTVQFKYSDFRKAVPFCFKGEIYTDKTEYAAMSYITNAARSFLSTHQRTERLADAIWAEYLDSKQTQLEF